LYNRFDRPLHLELGDSPLLLKAFLFLHLAGIFAWVVASLPLVWRLAAVSVLLLQFWRLHRLHVQPAAAHAVRALRWMPETGWQIKTLVGWRQAELCHPFYVTAWLVTARFRTSRFRRVTAIVVGDRTDADNFRRLRVRLLQCARGR